MQGERQQDYMVEKFAETLAVKNKAYDALVRQAKDAAAEAHADRLKSKKEAEDQRRRIQDLLVTGSPMNLLPILTYAY